MPSWSEPIMHDRQCVSDETGDSISTNLLSDLTGATFTARDLGQPGTYLVWLSVLISGSLNNTTAAFDVLVNGSTATMDRTIFLKIKDADVGYALLGCLEGVEVGDVLQVQWATDKGTLTLSEYNFMIDGIPGGRVVPA